MEISRLQEIFAEKVLHQVSVLSLPCRAAERIRFPVLSSVPTFSTKQETEINSIHQLVVGATENVKEGNEDIREVMFTWSPIKAARHLSRCFLTPASVDKTRH